MSKQRKAARAGAAAQHRQEQLKPAPREKQIAQLFNISCSLIWSDGQTTESPLANIFGSEEDYKRYKRYKDTGKAYPIRVEAIAPAEADKDKQSPIFPEGTISGDYAFIKKMCEDFTKALQQYLGIAPIDPLQLAEEAGRAFATQAEKASREMGEGIPILQGAEI